MAESGGLRRQVIIERTVKMISRIDTSAYVMGGKQMTDQQIYDFEIDQARDKSEFLHNMAEGASVADARDVEISLKVHVEDKEGGE